MVRASNRYLEGHGFDSRWGLRKILFLSISTWERFFIIYTLSKSPIHLSKNVLINLTWFSRSPFREYGIHNQGDTWVNFCWVFATDFSDPQYPIIVYFVAITCMAITHPILVTFGQMQFSYTNYVSFCLCICFTKPFNLFIIKLTDTFVLQNAGSYQLFHFKSPNFKSLLARIFLPQNCETPF